MVEDTPDDLVHELFTQSLWPGHSFGQAESRGARERQARSTGRSSGSISTRHTSHPTSSVVGRREYRPTRSQALVEPEFWHARPTGDAFTVLPPRSPASADPDQGAGAEPHLLGRGYYPQHHDDRYAELRAQHRARRLDELATVPERAREARPGLRGVQRPRRLSRRRQLTDLRRVRQRCGRRSHQGGGRRGARDEGDAARTPSSAAQRII